MKKIVQQFFNSQVNNGGPATAAIRLLNSNLKNDFLFIPMTEHFPKNYFKQFFYFISFIKKNNPDIVHIRGVHLEGFLGVLASRLLNKKVVLSVHGLYFDSLLFNSFKWRIFYFFIEKYALRLASSVYCVCYYTANRDYIKNNCKYNFYGVIHNAAPRFLIKNFSLGRDEVRSNFLFKQGDIVVSIISRVTIDKGFKVLLDSIPKLVEIFPNIKFVVAGEGPYLETFQFGLLNYIKEGKVFCLGKISNVPEILASSDIFLFPTLHENLSNSLLEALSLGVPSVVTDVGGNPEVVKHMYNGILIKPNSVQAIIQGISVLINFPELREVLSRNGLIFIEENFSPNFIYNELKKMYTSLL